MKKTIVILVSVLVALAVLAVGGVFDKLISLFEEVTTPIAEPAKGIYYLYSENFEKDTVGEAGYIRLDYLKNPQVTYRDFGDRISIQTPYEHYVIDGEGNVSIGDIETGIAVGMKKKADNYYLEMATVQDLKGFAEFGVSSFGSGDYTVYVNDNHGYKKGRLQAGAPVFASEEDFDEYVANKNRGGSSRGRIRGTVGQEGIEGYYYTLRGDGIDYAFFFSDDAVLTGFVDMDMIVAKSETEPRKKVEFTRFENLLLVWEAVYTDAVDTSEIGEMKGLNAVSPTWYALEDKNGKFSSLADNEYIKWAKQRNYVLWPLISNHSDIDLTNKFLASYNGQEAFIKGLIDEAVKRGYDGYNLDFEYIYLNDRDAYSHFVNRFSYEMRKWGLVTSVDVNVMDGADNWSKCYDHEVLGAVTELLIIMAYDEHHATSSVAGSVSSYNWVRYNLEKIAEVVDPGKIVLGVPFYMRVWETTASGTTSEVLSMKNTGAYLETLPFEISWDDLAKQQKATHSADGVLTEVWIEDAASLTNKVSLVGEHGLAGVAAWRRGFESDDVWEVLKFGELNVTTNEEADKDE